MEQSDADIVIDNKREVNMVSGDTEYFAPPSKVEFGKKYAFEDVCLDDEITPNIMIHTMSIKTEILQKNKIHLLEGIFYVDIEFIVKQDASVMSIEQRKKWLKEIHKLCADFGPIFARTYFLTAPILVD